MFSKNMKNIKIFEEYEEHIDGDLYERRKSVLPNFTGEASQVSHCDGHNCNHL
jgi:hypothetical protein